MKTKTCIACGNTYKFDVEQCPKCNSTKHTINLVFEDRVEVHDQVNGKSKLNCGKNKKPKLEFIAGEELRISTGKYVEKTRTINREMDLYKEKVTDIETGEVIHETDEKLSDHFGHGSDAPPKKDSK